MNDLLGALAPLVRSDRVDVERPLVLRESQRSRCGPIEVQAPGEVLALRLGDQDCLPLLSQLAKEDSVRRLPDYLLFAEPRRQRRGWTRELAIQVVVCELKSGSAGARDATRQIQLGKLLAKYLLGLASLQKGKAEIEAISIHYSGLIAVPQAMYHKGLTRPGATGSDNCQWDSLAEMYIHQVGDGGVADLQNLLR